MAQRSRQTDQVALPERIHDDNDTPRNTSPHKLKSSFEPILDFHDGTVATMERATKLNGKNAATELGEPNYASDDSRPDLIIFDSFKQSRCVSPILDCDNDKLTTQKV